MKKGLQNILLSATAALVLAACNLSTGQGSAVEDTQIGLRSVELKDEANVKNPVSAWKGDLPGSNEVYERSYENAPPLIPHSLEALRSLRHTPPGTPDCVPYRRYYYW